MDAQEQPAKRYAEGEVSHREAQHVAEIVVRRLGPLLARIELALSEQANLSSPPKTIVTSAELCSQLDWSMSTLRRWVKAGLPCFRDGRELRFSFTEVVEFLKSEGDQSALPSDEASR